MCLRDSERIPSVEECCEDHVDSSGQSNDNSSDKIESRTLIGWVRFFFFVVLSLHTVTEESHDNKTRCSRRHSWFPAGEANTISSFAFVRVETKSEASLTCHRLLRADFFSNMNVSSFCLMRQHCNDVKTMPSTNRTRCSSWSLHQQRDHSSRSDALMNTVSCECIVRWDSRYSEGHTVDEHLARLHQRDTLEVLH